MTAHLGAITIGGTLGSAAGRVSIIVAKGINAFPDTQFLPLTASVVNAAGITVSDADLRANTRVAIAGAGNLTGSIEVGHVLRLQFNSTGSTTGEIQAAVTATAENGSPVTDTGLRDAFDEPIYAEPMAFVRASKAIRGNLTATAGDIGIISIGVTEAATDGLQANVRPWRQIKSIYCAGAIGDAGGSPRSCRIWARDRIFEIIARDSEGLTPDAILGKDFYADVQSGKDRVSEGLPMPREDSTLTIIRTDGDFDGVIDVFNIARPEGGGDEQCGILIGGAMLCPINVEYVVHGRWHASCNSHALMWHGSRVAGPC